MKRRLRIVLLAAAAFAATCVSTWAGRPDIVEDTAKAAAVATPRTVHTASFYWHDEDRCRTVPATVYYPDGEDGDLPVILFSHGLGRSRFACAYLGRYWARAGYVSVHVEHYGSNEAVWRGSLRAKSNLKAAFYSQANRYHRPQDIRFAIDQLVELQAGDDPLGRRLDLERIGAIGHDFGAQTSLVLAGEALPGLPSTPDPRIKAVVAMSAPVPERGGSLESVFGGVSVPCLHVTGTRDDSLVATTRACQRRLPFDNMYLGDQYLVTFFGADHLIYAGHPLPRRNRDRNDGIYQRYLRTVTTLFWDAHLKQDPEALEAIAHGGLAAAVGRMGRVEQKSGTGPHAPVSWLQSADETREQ